MLYEEKKLIEYVIYKYLIHKLFALSLRDINTCIWKLHFYTLSGNSSLIIDIHIKCIFPKTKNHDTNNQIFVFLKEMKVFVFQIYLCDVLQWIFFHQDFNPTSPIRKAILFISRLKISSYNPIYNKHINSSAIQLRIDCLHYLSPSLSNLINVLNYG